MILEILQSTLFWTVISTVATILLAIFTFCLYRATANTVKASLKQIETSQKNILINEALTLYPLRMKVLKTIETKDSKDISKLKSEIDVLFNNETILTFDKFNQKYLEYSNYCNMKEQLERQENTNNPNNAASHNYLIHDTKKREENERVAYSKVQGIVYNSITKNEEIWNWLKLEQLNSSYKEELNTLLIELHCTALNYIQDTLENE